MTPPTEAQEQWGPWIEHDGRGCPCVGEYGQFCHDLGRGLESVCETVAGSDGGKSWDWSNSPEFTRIIRYRIRKPRALIEMIQRVEALPSQPERVDA